MSIIWKLHWARIASGALNFNQYTSDGTMGALEAMRAPGFREEEELCVVNVTTDSWRYLRLE
jgi:hypothetical protein